ncbi:C40 family peptidase [Frigoribacterium sp. PhB24]|uniref:C40 family peptidase n=1 Tax=Frigoribacterium sp. PhB24 TaxID=2485204 RepID=UPI0011CD854D|nr:C40 family peptidase [Frigoribacterium sp. PhB24]
MRPNRTVATRTPADLPTRSSLRRAQAAAAAAPARSGRPSVKRSVVSVTVMTLTAGLIGTMALPAFASNPAAANGPSVGASSTSASTGHAQSVAVGDDVALADATRDGYTATSQADLNAAALATQREAERAALAASYASYTGPTAADNVAAAASSASSTTGTVATPGAFSLSAVYNTALQYVGTPYVFGGATPAGFDCSGFVMYVYSQYGISLPHSVTRQGAMGTPISAAEAQPGDVVIFNDGSHDGFYAGNGMILDAPKPGGSVSVRPLWTSAVHYVRYGA